MNLNVQLQLSEVEVWVDRFIQVPVCCHHKLRASAFVGGTSKSLFLILF